MAKVVVTPKWGTISRYPGNRSASRWAVVLAGGRGTRMQSMIEWWLGEDRPKQFCTFIGTRSMLEHTLDRARAFASPDRIITVISRGQRAFLDQSLSSRAMDRSGMVIEQPRELGTAPGLHVALAYMADLDPGASVVVLPSDHFVYPEDRFLRYVDAALETAERRTDRLLLLGATPDRPETDYGWIESRSPHESPLERDAEFQVMGAVSFHEKPDRLLAQDLFRNRALWNTMVMTGKAKTFHVFGWRAVPEMMWHFETLRQVLRAVRDGRVPLEHEPIALEHVYRELTRADYSKDVLQRLTSKTLVLPMKGVLWSDWGRPERLRRTLEELHWATTVPAPVLNGIGVRGEREAIAS